MENLAKQKENKKQRDKNAMAEKFAGVYFVKLLFEQPEKLDETILFQALQKRFKEVDPIVEKEEMHVYGLRQYPVTYQDGQCVPSQISILEMMEFDRSFLHEWTMTQCWGLEDGDALLNRCHYELTIHDFMAAGHPRVKRCELLAEFVEAILEVFPHCIAMYFPHALKFLSREQFLQTSFKQRNLHFLDGGLSIRFFQIQDSEDMLVDTVGLSAVGVSDIQCHFHDLSVDAVIDFVAALACYLFKEGEIIQDGETVEGFQPEHAHWICQHEDALISPTRVVLDVNMLEYAAGNRNV